MLTYVLKRVLSTIPVMVIVAVRVFLLLRLAPGDPAAVIAGDYATAEDVERIRTQLGLNDPMFMQLWRWILQLASGDLGTAIFSKKPVMELIGQRIEPTLLLSLCTIVFAVAVAVGWAAGARAERAVAPLRAGVADAVHDLMTNLDVLTAYGALDTARFYAVLWHYLWHDRCIAGRAVGRSLWSPVPGGDQSHDDRAGRLSQRRRATDPGLDAECGLVRRPAVPVLWCIGDDRLQPFPTRRAALRYTLI